MGEHETITFESIDDAYKQVKKNDLAAKALKQNGAVLRGERDIDVEYTTLMKEGARIGMAVGEQFGEDGLFEIVGRAQEDPDYKNQ